MDLIESQKLKCIRLWVAFILVGLLSRVGKSIFFWETTQDQLVLFSMRTVVAIVLTIGVVLSFTSHLKAVYPIILVMQVGSIAIFFAESFEEIPENQDQQFEYRFCLGLVRLLNLYITQICINNLYPQYRNKMNYLAHTLGYLAMISNFVGFEYVRNYTRESIAILVFFLCTLLFGTYLQQKMNNLTRVGRREVEDMINTLKMNTSKDKKLSLVLESLEEGILMKQGKEVTFANQICKSMIDSLLEDGD